jgi:hypothetical protein
LPDPIPAERRRSARHAVGFGAMLRERGWGAGAVRVVDLSLHGCRIGLLAPLRPGASVWIRLPGLDSLYARVVWCRDDQAGLEFEAPLHPLILERLLV